MNGFKNVLVPVDFSESSKKSLEACSKIFAASQPMEFHFLHVWRSPSDYSPNPYPQKELEADLEKLVAGFALEGEHRTHKYVAVGQPTLEICKYAKERGCDLIVMPTHGRTGLARLLIGSTAEQVIRHAPCPVLSLRFPTEG